MTAAESHKCGWWPRRQEKEQGPDSSLLLLKVKLLQSLGLKSTLITDGSTPINLFNTALGLLGLGSEAQPPTKKAAGMPSPQEGLLLRSPPAPQSLGDNHVVP